MRWLISGVHSLSSVLRVGNAHFVDYLSRHEQDVLYLDAPISPLHPLLKRTDARYIERRRLCGLEPHQVAPNVLEYCPSTRLPILSVWPFSTRMLAKHSLQYTNPPLQDVLLSVNFCEPDVLVTTNLQYAELDAQLRFGRHVYWCKDDIAAFDHAPRCLSGMERDLLERVDLTVATSEHLCDVLRDRGAREVVCVRNGADVRRFEQDAAPHYEIERIPGPRVVFVGTLNQRIDTEAVLLAARRLPDVHFVLAGPWETNLRMLRGKKNIHLPGPVAPEALPGVFAAADAAMIPFRRSPLVESTCPIKVYEFLAAGLPVAATRWDEIERMEAPVELADGTEGFADAVERALNSVGDDAAGEERRAYARANSWDTRFEQLVGLAAGGVVS